MHRLVLCVKPKRSSDRQIRFAVSEPPEAVPVLAHQGLGYFSGLERGRQAGGEYVCPHPVLIPVLMPIEIAFVQCPVRHKIANRFPFLLGIRPPHRHSGQKTILCAHTQGVARLRVIARCGNPCCLLAALDLHRHLYKHVVQDRNMSNMNHY